MCNYLSNREILLKHSLNFVHYVFQQMTGDNSKAWVNASDLDTHKNLLLSELAELFKCTECSSSCACCLLGKKH